MALLPLVVFPYFNKERLKWLYMLYCYDNADYYTLTITSETDLPWEIKNHQFNKRNRQIQVDVFLYGKKWTDKYCALTSN